MASFRSEVEILKCVKMSIGFKERRFAVKVCGDHEIAQNEGDSRKDEQKLKKSLIGHVRKLCYVIADIDLGPVLQNMVLA